MGRKNEAAGTREKDIVKVGKLAIGAIVVIAIINVFVLYVIASHSDLTGVVSLTGLSASPYAFNPDEGMTEFRYSLNVPDGAYMLVEITDATGTVLRAIDGGLQQSGSRWVRWDGLADGGVPLPDDNYTATAYAGTRPWRDVPDKRTNGIANATTGVTLDRSPPDVEITSPGDGRTYELGQEVKASWSATDDPAGIGSVTCSAGSGTSLDTATVGMHEFIVTATDQAGNMVRKGRIYFVDDPKVALQYQHADVKIASAKGPASFDAEIADTSEKIYKGLMYRTSLASGAGMLFVFSGDQDHYFWMENTLLPLDLIYISSDYEVVGVRENALPNSVDQIPPPAPCKFVLEVNAGQCQKYGIVAGDDVEIITG